MHVDATKFGLGILASIIYGHEKVSASILLNCKLNTDVFLQKHYFQDISLNKGLDIIA